MDWWIDGWFNHASYKIAFLLTLSAWLQEGTKNLSRTGLGTVSSRNTEPIHTNVNPANVTSMAMATVLNAFDPCTPWKLTLRWKITIFQWEKHRLKSVHVSFRGGFVSCILCDRGPKSHILQCKTHETLGRSRRPALHEKNTSEIWVVPWTHRMWKKSLKLWDNPILFGWCSFLISVMLLVPAEYTVLRKCIWNFVWTHMFTNVCCMPANIFLVVFHLGHAMARPWDVALKNGRRYRSWSNEQRTVPGTTIPRNSRSAYGFKLVYVQLPWRKITSSVIELYFFLFFGGG